MRLRSPGRLEIHSGQRGSAASGMGSGADARDPRFAEAIIHEPVLFNLAKDPEETNNLAAQFPQKAKELKALLRKSGAIQGT